MPSFDIVSKVDMQAMDNAVNITKKEISNRFDFKDAPVEINFNKKDSKIDVETGSDMQVRQLVDRELMQRRLIYLRNLTKAVKQ
jgi:cyclic-di-GMP-binding protein